MSLGCKKRDGGRQGGWERNRRADACPLQSEERIVK
jgi:hypothetical protein